MATAEKTTATEEKYVDLFIPKGYANEEPNLLISINCKNFVLPRGKTSKVPTYVKEEFDRAMRAQEIFDKNSESLLEKAQKPIS